MPQNLEQLRADHASRAAPNTDRASASRLPAMILTNGLLATLAFAGEKDKSAREMMKAAADALARHLAALFPELAGISTTEALAARLAGGDAQVLQRATTEALAYLTYLKRYAPKKEARNS